MATVNEKHVRELIELLRQRQETVSLAESCTGGLFSAALTAVPGVSEVFIGSIVAYSNEVKIDLMDVPGSVIRTMGAVSRTTALKMAVGVRKRMKTTWSLAITGVAGPSGGTSINPVGTVCFAVSGPGVADVDEKIFRGDRRDIQVAAVEHGIANLLRHLKTHD